MGGGLKGHTQTQNNNNGTCGGRVLLAGGVGGGSRSYGLMLMFAFAFGAAVFGVMTLHKLKERRLFNLVLKDKELHLNSLHFHLQKERQYAKDAKRKSEEMKEKLYSLRNQKMELKGKMLEMQSTISSLREEHRALELALEEKQNEIKLMLQNKLDHQTTDRDPQTLRQKDAEIEDLRHNLGVPVKVWSVSTDDPSNPPVNLTTNLSIAQRDESISSSTERKTPMGDSSDGRGNRSISRHEDSNVNGIETKEPESPNKRSFGDLGMNYEGSMKLEIPDKLKSGESHRSRGIRATLRGVNGNKWRRLAKKRPSESQGNKSEQNEVASRRGRRYHLGEIESERQKMLREEKQQKQIRDKDHNMKENKNEKDGSKLKTSDGGKEERSEDVKEGVVSSEIKLPKLEDFNDTESGYTSTANSKLHGNYKISRKLYHSLDEVQLNKTIEDEGNGTIGGDKRKPSGIVQPEGQAHIFLQYERHGIDSKKNQSTLTNAADKDEEPEDVEENHESRSSKFSTKSEEDGADYKDKTDEPEFS